ncbi:MAG: PPC domain-containing protein, partial [Pirellulales bacterium]
AGAARGASVQVTAGGNPGSWPAQVWVNRPGVSIAATDEKGKFSVTVAEDALPGGYWIRIYNAEGSAAPLPFIVGTVPEINEQEPNDNFNKPQLFAESACTVNGRLEKRGDVDTFAMSLKKGQTLVAAVTAHEMLGSPMDAVLQIVSPRGTALAQNDDERGLDPLLTFTAPADGLYLVRVFAFPATADASISFAGGETFIYRLTVTTGGFLDSALPLAVSRTQNTTVEAYGWNFAGADTRRTIEPPSDQSAVDLFSPQWAGALSLPVVDMPTTIEVEPNDAARPQTVELPVSMSGRIGEDRDQDVFRFHLAKGKAWRFKVESRALGYPLDCVLRLVDSLAKTLATSDDAGKNVDAELTYTASADADYTLILSDLYQHGGPRYFYRLSIEPLEPDFALSVPQHAYTLTIGKPLEIPVTIDRRQSFAGDIEIAVPGLPDSVTVSPAKSIAKDGTSKTVKLTLTASTTYSGPFRIVGKSSEPLSRSHLAESLAPAAAALSGLWLTVVK